MLRPPRNTKGNQCASQGSLYHGFKPMEVENQRLGLATQNNLCVPGARKKYAGVRPKVWGSLGSSCWRKGSALVVEREHPCQLPLGFSNGNPGWDSNPTPTTGQVLVFLRPLSVHTDQLVDCANPGTPTTHPGWPGIRRTLPRGPCPSHKCYIRDRVSSNCPSNERFRGKWQWVPGEHPNPH